MATVLTVQADLNGNAASIIAASKAGSRAISDFARSAQNANRGFSSLGQAVTSAVRGGIVGIDRLVSATVKVGVAAVAAGGVAAGAFAFKAASAGLQRLEAIQDSTVALTRMLGSSAAAAALTAKALAVVQGTPFAFPQFAEATRTLVAFGVSADKVPGVLQAIADSAAASGQGAAAVDGLTQSFARLQVQGKMSSDILQSLGTSGVNGLGILANAFGKSTADMQKMISDGLVPADQAMSILVNGIENGSHGIAGNFNAIKGAAKDLGQTISGSLGNVKAAFARMGASWLKPFEKDIPKALNSGVIPLLDKLGAAGARVTTMFAKTGVIDKFTTLMGRLKSMVDPATTGFIGLVRSLSPLVIVWKAIQGVLPQVMESLRAVGRVVVSQVIPGMASLFKALVPLLPALTNLIANLAQGLGSILPGITGGITMLVNSGLVPLLNAIAGLPTPLLGLVTAFSLLAKVGVPMGGIMDGIGNALGGLREKAQNIGGTIGQMATMAFGPWGVAAGAAAAIIGGIWFSKIAAAKQLTADFTATLDENTGSMTKNTRATAVKALQDAGAYKAAAILGIGYDTVTDAALGNKDALLQIATAQDAATKKYQEGASASDNSSGKYLAAANKLSAAIGSTKGAVEAAKASDIEFAKAMGIVKTAQDDLGTSLSAATQSIATNGHTFDQATVQGQNNKAALDRVSDSTNSLIEANARNGASEEQLQALYTSSRAKLYSVAAQMGLTGAAADNYVNGHLKKIPDVVKTNVMANTDTANKLVDQFATAVNRLNGKVVTVYAQANIDQAMASLDRLRANSMITANLYATGDAYRKANGGMMIHGVDAFANGGMQAFASGGVQSGIYAARNPGIVKFAEPETRWEAYISGKPGQEKRNAALAMEALHKLGYSAGGGSTVNVTNNIHGTDPQMVADLLSQGLMSKLGY